MQKHKSRLMLNDMDWDMAGALGRLLAALKEQGMTADEAFEQIDTDEDGKLNGPELLNGLSALLAEHLDRQGSHITSSTSTSTTASTCLSGARCSVPPAKKSETRLVDRRKALEGLREVVKHGSPLERRARHPRQHG